MFKDQKQCCFGGDNITISKLIKNFNVVKLYCYVVKFNIY